ncbi:hypothetical protein Bca52824_043920 [Brassica carinata]|uniref:Cystatin domain-containing protein n=1 Tax=Brassica carinata TaxID=52824 RepID=A0A8X7S0D4_BRACI|nr:hypothetical protein Bca52824_043920 [Brassica carinata]
MGKDYEIISDPFDPRCVVACFIRLQRQTDKEKLLLERIRGKEDSTSQKYTDQEERSLINEQISKSQRTNFEFVEVEKANLYRSKGYIYFITFVAKDPCDQTIVFQAKVCNVLCREIEHSFCRLKPGQQGE